MKTPQRSLPLRRQSATHLFAVLITSLSIIIGIASFFLQSTLLLIVGAAAVTTAGLIKTKFNPLHPAVWFVPIVFLYQFSYSILGLMGEVFVVDHWLLAISNYLFFVTVASTLAFTTPFVYHPPKSDTLPNSNLRYWSGVGDLFLLVLIALMLYASLVFWSSGVVRKNESIAQEVLPLAYAFRWFVTLFTLRLVVKLGEKNPSVRRLVVEALVGAVFLLLITVLIGERDLFLSFSVVVGLVFLYYGVIQRRHVLIIATILLALIPIMQTTKTAFSRIRAGETIQIFTNESFLVSLLSDDFAAAGRNFNLILETTSQRGFFWGETILWDISRTIVPGNIVSSQHAAKWFNDTYFAHGVARGYGWGFSFAAEGYINFGFVGVYLWGLILVALVTILYHNSKKDVLYFVLYILAIPWILYTLRGDLYVLVSPLLKQALLPILIVLFLQNWKLPRKRSTSVQLNRNRMESL